MKTRWKNILSPTTVKDFLFFQSFPKDTTCLHDKEYLRLVTTYYEAGFYGCKL